MNSVGCVERRVHHQIPPAAAATTEAMPIARPGPVPSHAANDGQALPDGDVFAGARARWVTAMVWWPG
jgi:hypothetical protein